MMSASQTEEVNDHTLPSFATFTTELDPQWEYYDRNERSQTDVITSSQTSNSYTRPWEMDSKDHRGFEPFPKLPSFQSQFHSFSDTQLVPEPSLPQVTAVPVPISPSSASPVGTGGSLTQLTQLTPTPLTSLSQSGVTLGNGVVGNGLGGPLQQPSFHTLTAVNTRTYPLVPAPIQARDIPTINHQYLDERHIQLYQPITTFPQTSLVTVIKKEPNNYDLNNGTLHHTNFQNPLLDNGFNDGHLNHVHQQHQQQLPQQPLQQQQQQQLPPQQPLHNNHNHMSNNNTLNNNHKINNKAIKQELETPTRNDMRKKERRKMRASSLESSAESEGSAMEIGEGNSGQVAAVSSTANFKSPMHTMGMGDENGEPGEKQVSILVP